MSEIQRYSEEGGHSCDDVYMCADDCGEWVRYEEHKARIQELEKHLAAKDRQISLLKEKLACADIVMSRLINNKE